MRTWWVWASILALSVSPTLAEPRERARERSDGGGGRSSSSRHSDRGQRPSERPSRESADRGSRRWEQPSGRSSETPRQRFDRWAGSERRSDRTGRSSPTERPRRSFDRTNRDFSSRDSRYSDRGRNTRDNWRYSGGDRRTYDRRSYGSTPRYNRFSRSFHNRPRYPSYYRYGYYHSHGFFFPRYYYDYSSYPTYASIRVLVEPAEAEVYVDGYYAGTVDDFDGVFQRLHVAPGDHEITLRLDGFETWSAGVYAPAGGTVRLRYDMVPGVSEGVIEDDSNEPGDQEPEQ
jgi:hypothetical protein